MAGEGDGGVVRGIWVERPVEGLFGRWVRDVRFELRVVEVPVEVRDARLVGERLVVVVAVGERDDVDDVLRAEVVMVGLRVEDDDDREALLVRR